MNTPTPRTDAAWAQTFDANGFLSGRGNAASDMRDECATLERELIAALTIDKLDDAAKDKERLDWLAVSDTWFDYPATESFNPETFRDAIDAAMKNESNTP